MGIEDGSTYAPRAKADPVVGPGEFRFAAAHLDHGHIYGQTQGLLDAGGTLAAVHDSDPGRIAAFLERFPGTPVAGEFDRLLADDSLHLIAGAAVPDRRAAIGQRVMRAGKDYFTDKSPFTTLEQLAATRRVVAETGRKYLVYYSERLHNEAAWHAGELIAAGAIGRVVHVLNIAPHRLSPATRPPWFFEKARYGGILTDIGSHQVEQYLTYAGCSAARVDFARATNMAHPDHPGLEDFGELALTGDNGATCYARIDWLTPDGMPVWGDGRTFVVATDGTLEIRKYVDPGRQAPASIVLVSDADGVRRIDCLNRVGFPFFGRLILDVLNRTEHAMTQAHAFRAAEISLRAQLLADGRPEAG